MEIGKGHCLGLEYQFHFPNTCVRLALEGGCPAQPQDVYVVTVREDPALVIDQQQAAAGQRDIDATSESVDRIGTQHTVVLQRIVTGKQTNPRLVPYANFAIDEVSLNNSGNDVTLVKRRLTVGNVYRNWP